MRCQRLGVQRVELADTGNWFEFTEKRNEYMERNGRSKSRLVLRWDITRHQHCDG